jgi:diguanylate cyclase (GGDEF)-like protein
VLDDLGATDPLTGLPGRRRTEELLDVAVWDARTGHDALALLVLTVDGLGAVTDRFGPASADDLLRTTARRLRTRLRRGDVLGRIGPGRFAVALGALAPVAAAAEAERISASLLDAVRSPFVVSGEPVVLDAQIGSALCPADGEDVPSLLRAATAGWRPRTH